MEKSFSDLFKRFEKQKDVIEGYRTVGAWPARGPRDGGVGIVASRAAWQAVTGRGWGPCRKRG